MIRLAKFSEYIFIKYAILYSIYFMISGSMWDWGKLNDKENIIYTIIVLFSLPILEILFLFLPFTLALKQKGIKVLISLSICFIFEFFISWFFSSESIESWMIVKIGLSIVLFSMIYRKDLKTIIFKVEQSND
jgi:hypothetical protein